VPYQQVRGFWQDKENCAKAAASCKSRGEFHVRFRGAYTNAAKNGWLDEICSHILPVKGSGRSVYIIENHESIYIGLSVNPERRFKQHQENGKFFGFNMRIVLSHLTNENAAKLERALIDAAIKDGSKTVLNLRRGGSLGKTYEYWNRERTIIAALECNTRTSFFKKYPRAYAKAKEFGIFEEVCSHMASEIKPVGYWNKSRCFEVGQSCVSKKEFRENHSSAYQTAYRNGWLDEICARMYQAA
jgi:predicted GIY-YIG superfamily endonuclease